MLCHPAWTVAAELANQLPELLKLSQWEVLTGQMCHPVYMKALEEVFSQEVAHAWHKKL